MPLIVRTIIQNNAHVLIVHTFDTRKVPLYFSGVAHGID